MPKIRSCFNTVLKFDLEAINPLLLRIKCNMTIVAERGREENMHDYFFCVGCGIAAACLVHNITLNFALGTLHLEQLCFYFRKYEKGYF